MLRHCHLLGEPTNINSDHLVISTLTTFQYRLQKIVSIDGELLGFEVLLDFVAAQRELDNGMLQYTQAINDGRALDNLLNCLLTKKSKINAVKLFINVERMNLCNKMLLRKIVAAARHLYVNYDIELVVEITERNQCGYCADILHGLVFLKKNKVTLAADDYDIYGKDFRIKEINVGLYDYIKVVMPTTPAEATVLNAFVSGRTEKVILEMVEDHQLIRSFQLSPKLYAYQGFAYC
ncbi:hypothetical protein [Aeromonas veronii]|uniref:hypothetical protein n=1 Tax=Aeromonas veronii TaxID=654 RepID=UPI003D1EBC01